MLRLASVLFILVFGASQALAVVFEKERVNSYLGQPLKVEIPISLKTEEAKGNTQVSLATPQEYLTLEQTIPRSYLQLRVDVDKTSSANWLVKVSSSQAIDESYLVVVLKVQRGRGNYFKRVQLFLNPMPAVAYEPAANVSSQTSPKLLPKASIPGPVVLKESFVLTPQGLSNDWARRTTYGPVQSGDSLSVIAYRLRKDKRFSNREVMLSLFDGNPQAFVNEDINHLKKGSFLDVPSGENLKKFIVSPQYKKLEVALLKAPVKNKKMSQKKQVKKVQAQNIAPESKYRSRISLGMVEDLEEKPQGNQGDANIEGLESLYQQVMATELKVVSIETKVDSLFGKVDGLSDKVDSVGGEVGALATELRTLHRKVDSLSINTGVNNEGQSISYVWLLFILLLILNFILLLLYLYRKKMKSWQDKLTQVQRKSFAFSDAHPMKSEPKEAPGKVESEVLEKPETPKFEKQVLSKPVAQDVNLEPTDYALAFEVAVHQKDFSHAMEYYDLMPALNKMKPRTQVLYVQLLHLSGELLERNNTLLELFKKFPGRKWVQFCSFFDEDIWLHLQEENIIDLHGNVREEEVLRLNSLAAEQLKDSELKLDAYPKDDPNLSNIDLQDKEETGHSMLEPKKESIEDEGDAIEEHGEDYGEIDWTKGGLEFDVDDEDLGTDIEHSYFHLEGVEIDNLKLDAKEIASDGGESLEIESDWTEAMSAFDAQGSDGAQKEDATTQNLSIESELDNTNTEKSPASENDVSFDADWTEAMPAFDAQDGEDGAPKEELTADSLSIESELVDTTSEEPTASENDVSFDADWTEAMPAFDAQDGDGVAKEEATAENLSIESELEGFDFSKESENLEKEEDELLDKTVVLSPENAKRMRDRLK